MIYIAISKCQMPNVSFLSEMPKMRYLTQMGGFPQPLQKFAAAGENYDFVSAVNLYPKKETLFVSTQILNLSANNKKS